MQLTGFDQAVPSRGTYQQGPRWPLKRLLLPHLNDRRVKKTKINAFKLNLYLEHLNLSSFPCSWLDLIRPGPAGAGKCTLYGLGGLQMEPFETVLTLYFKIRSFSISSLFTYSSSAGRQRQGCQTSEKNSSQFSNKKFPDCSQTFLC